MYKKIGYAVCLGCCVFLMGCNHKGEAGSTESQKMEDVVTPSKTYHEGEFSEESSEELGVYYADLFHDGTETKITVDISRIENVQQQPVEVNVYGKSGEVCWCGSLGYPHMSWGYYYLVSYEKQDYLLFYLLEEAQGMLCYTLRLFHFDDEGKQVMDNERSICYVSEEQWEIDLKSFNQELNAYLDQSVLLASIFDFELDY